MKRFFSSLKRNVKPSSSSAAAATTTITINNTFKSEVHAQSATNIKRQEWIKKRNEMLTNTSNVSSNNDKIMDSNGFVKNGVKKLGNKYFKIIYKYKFYFKIIICILYNHQHYYYYYYYYHYYHYSRC